MFKKLYCFTFLMFAACSQERVSPDQIFVPLSEKELKRTDFPPAISFQCPEDTQSVYGYHCGSNKTFICADSNCSSWQTPNCNSEPEFFQVCVDKYEYPGKGKLPEQVTLEEAKNICQSHDGHLCGQEEWQEACQGNIKSPYGSLSWTRSSECNFSGNLRKSGSNPECRNVHGVVDMIGNGKEWQSEGTIGYQSCVESIAAVENTNSFRCCYSPLNK